MQSQFTHLHVHSEYSLKDGMVRLDPLMAELESKGMNAIALTDYCNLFAAVKLFQAAVAEGIKPIIGCDIPWHYADKPTQIYSVVLLCQSNQGYRNLTRLVSKAYQNGQHKGQPRVAYDWLAEHSDGLIALSGGLAGDIGHSLASGDSTSATERAIGWSKLFPGRFYLEIQRTGREGEAAYNQQLVTLAEANQLPLVATNDVRFLRPEDFDAHEARVCIHDGCTLSDPRRVKRYSPEQYLRSADEMVALFHDLPQAITNTVEISKRCSVTLELGKNYLPNFPVPSGASVETYLAQLAKEGLEARLKQLFREDPAIISSKRAAYEERLTLEIDVINSMGFAGYFLIVADFIKWARENGVPVGPGRGSGAGSLVAYSLAITDLDPLAYDLLFERFLNPERVSMPDFDIDFCMEGRDRVIEYVAERYGRQSVSQIITFGTMAAKAVVRDVGRVLGHPYGFVDKLAKLIPFELGMTLEKALEQEDELKRRYDAEEEVSELIDLARKLEGITRNAGKHAGGVVIAPSELTDFTAIYCEEGSSQIVSQFDKDDVEAAGLVKFDFLGLRTLTIINWALITINQQRKANQLAKVVISDIPLDDPKTYQLLQACQTTAVFQLESRGMKELIHRLQPDCFEDIVALVALFRPGPLQSGMVDDFIDRKHGRARVEYPHPDLEPILKPTYGVILYQEQVMQIAQVLANYTLGAADLLRRAMGKKKPEEMAKQREIFVAGATARDVDETVASTIFDLMEKFAGYGFNKSHSAAYALVAYQTAWLKAHFPAAFMAAVLSSDMDSTDKVVNFIQDTRAMGLTLLPPKINLSQYHFTVQDEKTLIYGLGAIKGVGSSAIDGILEARKEGPFVGLFDLCRRVDLRKMNKRVIEASIKSGALDEWGIDRAVLAASLDKAMTSGAQYLQNQALGQANLFSLFDEGGREEDYLEETPWSDQIRLAGEKETLGLYLTGHPAARYSQEFSSVTNPIAALNSLHTKKAMICGLIRGARRLLTKRGKKLIILGMEDASGSMDVVVFSEVFETQETLLQTGNIILISGELSQDDYTGGLRMTASAILSLAEARSRFAKCIQLKLSPNDQALLPGLQAVFKANKGDCVVQIHYSNAEAQAAINLAAGWRVAPSDDVLDYLAELLGRERVEVCY